MHSGAPPHNATSHFSSKRLSTSFGTSAEDVQHAFDFFGKNVYTIATLSLSGDGVGYADRRVYTYKNQRSKNGELA